MAVYSYTPLKERDRHERASHYGDLNSKDVELLASKKYKELYDNGRTIYDPGYERWLRDTGRRAISRSDYFYSVDTMSRIHKFGEPDFSDVLFHKFGVDELPPSMIDIMQKVGNSKLKVYEKGVPKTITSYYDHPFLNNLESFRNITSSEPRVRKFLWEETRGLNRFLRYDLSSLSARWKRDFGGVVNDISEKRDPRLVVGKLNSLGRSVAADSFTHFAMGGAVPDDIIGPPKEWNKVARLRMRYSEPLSKDRLEPLLKNTVVKSMGRRLYSPAILDEVYLIHQLGQMSGTVHSNSSDLVDNEKVVGLSYPPKVYEEYLDRNGTPAPAHTGHVEEYSHFVKPVSIVTANVKTRARQNIEEASHDYFVANMLKEHGVKWNDPVYKNFSKNRRVMELDDVTQKMKNVVSSIVNDRIVGRDYSAVAAVTLPGVMELADNVYRHITFGDEIRDPPIELKTRIGKSDIAKRFYSQSVSLKRAVERGAEAYRIKPVDVAELNKNLDKKSSEFESMYSSGKPINTTKYGDYVLLRRKGIHPQAGVGSVFDDFDYLPSVDTSVPSFEKSYYKQWAKGEYTAPVEDFNKWRDRVVAKSDFLGGSIVSSSDGNISFVKGSGLTQDNLDFWDVYHHGPSEMFGVIRNPEMTVNNVISEHSPTEFRNRIRDNMIKRFVESYEKFDVEKYGQSPRLEMSPEMSVIAANDIRARVRNAASLSLSHTIGVARQISGGDFNKFTVAMTRYPGVDVDAVKKAETILDGFNFTMHYPKWKSDVVSVPGAAINYNVLKNDLAVGSDMFMSGRMPALPRTSVSVGLRKGHWDSAEERIAKSSGAISISPRHFQMGDYNNPFDADTMNESLSSKKGVMVVNPSVSDGSNMFSPRGLLIDDSITNVQLRNLFGIEAILRGNSETDLDPEFYADRLKIEPPPYLGVGGVVYGVKRGMRDKVLEMLKMYEHPHFAVNSEKRGLAYADADKRYHIFKDRLIAREGVVDGSLIFHGKGEKFNVPLGLRGNLSTNNLEVLRSVLSERIPIKSPYIKRTVNSLSYLGSKGDMYVVKSDWDTFSKLSHFEISNEGAPSSIISGLKLAFPFVFDYPPFKRSMGFRNGYVTAETKMVLNALGHINVDSIPMLVSSVGTEHANRLIKNLYNNPRPELYSAPIQQLHISGEDVYLGGGDFGSMMKENVPYQHGGFATWLSAEDPELYNKIYKSTKPYDVPTVRNSSGKGFKVFEPGVSYGQLLPFTADEIFKDSIVPRRVPPEIEHNWKGEPYVDPDVMSRISKSVNDALPAAFADEGEIERVPQSSAVTVSNRVPVNFKTPGVVNQLPAIPSLITFDDSDLRFPNLSPVGSSTPAGEVFMMQELKTNDVKLHSPSVETSGLVSPNNSDSVAKALSFGGASNSSGNLELTGVTTNSNSVKPSNFDVESRKDEIYTRMYNEGVNVDDPEFRQWQEYFNLRVLPYHPSEEVLPKQSINVSSPSSDVSFTPEEEAKFTKRDEEGYDLDTDSRYNSWKSLKKNPSVTTKSPVKVVVTPGGVDVKNDVSGLLLLDDVHKKIHDSSAVVTPSVTSYGMINRDVVDGLSLPEEDPYILVDRSKKKKKKNVAQDKSKKKKKKGKKKYSDMNETSIGESDLHVRSPYGDVVDSGMYVPSVAVGTNREDVLMITWTVS